MARIICTAKISKVPRCREAPLGEELTLPIRKFNTTVVPTGESNTFSSYIVEVGSTKHGAPFKHRIFLRGEGNKTIGIQATWDDGCTVAALSTKKYEEVKESMEGWETSRCLLRMANRNIVPSAAHWKGDMTIGGITRQVNVEVFDSGGGWEFLLGKPVMQTFGLIHDYSNNTVKVPAMAGEQKTLYNEILGSIQTIGKESDTPQTQTNNAAMDMGNTTAENQRNEEDNMVEIPLGDKVNQGIYTRNNDPFKEERVDAILAEINIGLDLTEEQRKIVQDTIRKYADCFALSVSEVFPVEGAIHKVEIPKGAVFPRVAHQKPLTPPQREYLNRKVQEMLDAGIIEHIQPDQVKNVAPMVLSQKAHEGEGLGVEELKRRLNEQCVQAGLEMFFDIPPRQEEEKLSKELKPQKWRVCQNFSALNKVTQVVAMPQGDIRLKQQRLSGHCWVNTFDFTSGFYAVTVAEESRPYICFYVEGWGYFWYKRMPFVGLTGAPSTFADLTGTHLHNIIAEGDLELFVDDGGQAGDTFEEMMKKTIRLLEQVRERKLSLLASKSNLFMTEALFAGACVGPTGVMPDLTKLTAVINWSQPKDCQELVSFLGLTSHFRDLIKGYVHVEAPLRDLVKEVKLPPNYTKTNQAAMKKATLDASKWTLKHTKAF